MQIEKIFENRKLFIFDLDGTLVDLEKLNYTSFKNSVETSTILEFKWEDYQKYFSGNGSKKGFELYKITHPNLSISSEQLLQIYRDAKWQELQNNFHQNVKLIPFAKEFLEELKKLNKKIVLATSTSKDFANLILNNFNINIFTLVLTENSVVNTKPSPEIYIKAMTSMNFQAIESVIFEDSLKGLKAARDSRALVVQVKTLAIPYKDQNADIIIDNYKELLDSLRLRTSS